MTTLAAADAHLGGRDAPIFVAQGAALHFGRLAIAHRPPILAVLVAVLARIGAADAIDLVRRVRELQIAADEASSQLHRPRAAVTAGAVGHARHLRFRLIMAARAGFVRGLGAMGAVVGSGGMAVLALIVK